MVIINKIHQYNIPFVYFNKIKSGDDYEDDFGNIIKNEELTIPSPPPRSYAFCSDTIYDESIINDVKGVDILYHEATFLHEMADRAQATYHTTSLQAAEIAKKAEVKKLIIGHFSARYKNLGLLLD